MTQSALLPLTVSDLVCFDDVDAGGAETTSDLQTLIQDVYHVLIEKRGSNIDDPTRGADVEGKLSGTSSDLVTIAQEIESELQKDDRITSCQAAVSFLTPGSSAPDGTLLPNGGWLLEVDIQPASSIAPSAQSLAYYFSQQTGLVAA